MFCFCFCFYFVLVFILFLFCFVLFLFCFVFVLGSIWTVVIQPVGPFSSKFIFKKKHYFEIRFFLVQIKVGKSGTIAQKSQIRTEEEPLKAELVVQMPSSLFLLPLRRSVKFLEPRLPDVYSNPSWSIKSYFSKTFEDRRLSSKCFQNWNSNLDFRDCSAVGNKSKNKYARVVRFFNSFERILLIKKLIDPGLK